MKSRLLRLREHVSDLHSALEETSAARQLLEGEIGRSRYVELHGQLYHIHGALDDAYVACSELEPFWHPEDLRSTILEQDLSNLGCESPPPASNATGRLLDTVPGLHETWPGRVGTLYVVKGGRFGAEILIDPVSSALDISGEPGSGVDYYLHGQEELPRQWRAFTKHVNEASLSLGQEEALFKSARGLFEGLLEVYRSV